MDKFDGCFATSFISQGRQKTHSSMCHIKSLIQNKMLVWRHFVQMIQFYYYFIQMSVRDILLHFKEFRRWKKPMESILFGKCSIFFLIVAKKNYGNDSILFFAFFDSTLKINFVRNKYLELSKGSKIFIFVSWKNIFYQAIFNICRFKCNFIQHMVPMLNWRKSFFLYPIKVEVISVGKLLNNLTIQQIKCIQL